MGRREVTVKETVAISIAEISWYVEFEGLIAAAEKFSNGVYDYFLKLADSRRSPAVCKDPERAVLGYKCVSYKRKYTIVFLETNEDLIICELLPSKSIHW